MAKQLSWYQVEKTIRQSGLTLFSPQDLRHLLRGSETSVRFLLTRAHKRSAIVKLRRELYALSDNPPSELEMANALLRPSYISFHYALAYYHLIPEAVFEIASVTTRTTRRFEALGKVFSYHHVERTVFTGYHPEKIRDRIVLIADAEKALVDSLYFESLHQLSLPERLDISTLDLERAAALARLFRRSDLILEKMEALQ